MIIFDLIIHTVLIIFDLLQNTIVFPFKLYKLWILNTRNKISLRQDLKGVLTNFGVVIQHIEKYPFFISQLLIVVDAWIHF